MVWDSYFVVLSDSLSLIIWGSHLNSVADLSLAELKSGHVYYVLVKKIYCEEDVQNRNSPTVR
jgi:hypothetical protein